MIRQHVGIEVRLSGILSFKVSAFGATAVCTVYRLSMTDWNALTAFNAFTFADYKKAVDKEGAEILSERRSMRYVEVLRGLADALWCRLLIVTYRFSSSVQAHTFSM